jgi:PGF-CTERM protein
MTNHSFVQAVLLVVCVVAGGFSGTALAYDGSEVTTDGVIFQTQDDGTDPDGQSGANDSDDSDDPDRSDGADSSDDSDNADDPDSSDGADGSDDGDDSDASDSDDSDDSDDAATGEDGQLVDATSVGLPGFGAPVAVVALLVGAHLLAWRT